MHKKIIAVTASCLSIFAAQAAPENEGAVSFDIIFQKQLQNGNQAVPEEFTIFSIKNLCTLKAKNDKSAAAIHWIWVRKGVIGMGLLLPEFKKNIKYAFFMTWNAHKGLFDCYINGYPIRIPETKLRPWRASKPGTTAIKKGPFTLDEFKMHDRYFSPQEVAKLSPPQKTNPLLSCTLSNSTMKQIESKRGKLLYDGSISDPEFANWTKEGPANSYFKDGWEVFESTKVKEKKHIVWWCPEKFPESFIAEWEVKILSEYGLCIVFFAADGKDGQNIFDVSMPKRDGTFTDYTSGKINSYHISYLTNAGHNPGRPQVNLRKNNSFYLMAQGAAGIPFDKKIHKVFLSKNKSRIFMTIDGRPVIDYIDNDAKRYGTAYNDGWIGLRQMSWTIGAYRNFKVWEIKP